MFVRHDHSEAFILLDLFRPDDAVICCRPYAVKVRIEERVGVDDQDGLIDTVEHEPDGSSCAVHRLLFDEIRGRIRVVLCHVLAELIAVRTGDEEVLCDGKPCELVEDMLDYRPAGDRQ